VVKNITTSSGVRTCAKTIRSLNLNYSKNNQNQFSFEKLSSIVLTTECTEMGKKIFVHEWH